jgi:GTPase-associated protein 1, N-terminal domain type 2/GTPase-associated protein 1, C-terminal domain/GTPase-associated protein 1, middle domain
VAFQQLYYTSCENGLGGYGGYQFNAITPGVSAAVMREVEDRTVYEPPGWLLADPCPDEPEAYPVAFSYGTSEATGAAITAQVVFTGTDYSGRPGNYFAHALVTNTPEQDFGPLLPAELWGAELWHTSPVDGTELPELSGPPPPGAIDRPGVQAFLDARGADGVLPGLLTAVGRAMAGDRPVLVVSHDVSENIWWIAAISYLLGEHLGHRMTFTTYSHRPGYSRYHLTGILPETLPPSADSSFQLFDLTVPDLTVPDLTAVDLTAGPTPGGGVHPLAAILARTGVMAAPGLWQQAMVFASGAEESLDDWLAPVAAAAGLLGRELSPAETDAVAGWLLGAAGWMPAQLADVVLGVALAQPDGTADQRLLDLLGLARRLPAPARVERLELLLAERAVTHLARGEAAVPVRLTSAAADAARVQAAQVLVAATPATALAVLEWAAASEVALPDAELERYGRTRLDPGTPEPELTGIVSRSPAALRGLIDRLAGEPPEVAEALLAGPAGDHIRRSDLAAYPVLTELWLLESAARGGLAPLDAFDEIADVRARAQRSPRVDAALLGRLWPDGCPPEQIAELLGAATGEEPAPGVLDWIVTEIGAVARGPMNDGSLRLAQALAGHPVLGMLPEGDARIMRNAARVEPLLRRARSAGPQGDVAVFAELFAAYLDVDDDTRSLLDQYLPPLLSEAEPLGGALGGCPDGLAAAVCRELGTRLAPPADVALARRVFVAMTDPDVLDEPALSDRLPAAFERVRGWRRRDLGALARALADDEELARLFQAWRDEQRGGLARRLFGGGPGRPASAGGPGRGEA